MGNWKHEFIYWTLILSIVVLIVSGFFGLAISGTDILLKTRIFIWLYLGMIIISIGIIIVIPEELLAGKPKKKTVKRPATKKRSRKRKK